MNRTLLLLFVFVIVLLGALYFGVVQRALSPNTAPATNAASTATDSDVAPTYTYQIVNTYPHDRRAFTQGLIFADDGFLYEGTGLYGESTLRKVDLETGNVLKLQTVPAQYFGEGITLWGDKLIELTWREHRGFVYDKESFHLLREFSYPTEGWGITHDERHLIMSDGSSTLYFLDPNTFKEMSRVEVHNKGTLVVNLNELEYIGGKIYANIWQTDRIAIIAPETGQVLGWMDLTGLLSNEDRSQPVDVLNGIAYDAKGDSLFVTGKLWPKLFEIQLIPPK